MELTGKQRRYLRGLGHALAPVVRVGKGGIDEGLVRALDQALVQHELIKVKLESEAPVQRHEAAELLTAQTGSAVAQVLGRTILLYRPHPREPRIALPR